MKVKPDFKVKCVTHLDAEWCVANCVESLLLDVDGTLRARNADGFKDKVLLWIRDLKQEKINICLVSNAKRKKIKRIAKELNVPFIAEAEKPSSLGIKAAMQAWSYCPDTTVMVGDSKVDIIAGHCAGIRTVCVKRIEDEDDEFEWWDY